MKKKRQKTILAVLIYFFRDDYNMIKSKLYEKRDDFNFPIVNYPFLDSNIAKGPTYGIYISQLICFARACSYAEDFVVRHNYLIDKLLHQGFQKENFLIFSINNWTFYVI